MIKLLICDDHEMVRTGMVRALQAEGHCRVIAEAASAPSLLALLEEGTDAELLLLDLNLGSAGLASGIRLIAQVRNRAPNLALLVVSMHNDPAVVRSALDAGAHGFVTKESAITVLEQAIAEVHQGRRFLDPALGVTWNLTGRAKPATAWDTALTRREREVLEMLIDGWRVSEIAQNLALSIKTVSTHKVRLMEKLNIDNNADLIKLGLLNRTGPRDQAPVARLPAVP